MSEGWEWRSDGTLTMAFATVPQPEVQQVDLTDDVLDAVHGGQAGLGVRCHVRVQGLELCGPTARLNSRALSLSVVPSLY